MILKPSKYLELFGVIHYLFLYREASITDRLREAQRPLPPRPADPQGRWYSLKELLVCPSRVGYLG